MYFSLFHHSHFIIHLFLIHYKKDYNNVNKWLITELPSHVKLIVSTIPDHGNILTLISKLITKKITSSLTPDSKLLDEMIEKQLLRVKQLGKYKN